METDVPTEGESSESSEEESESEESEEEESEEEEEKEAVTTITYLDNGNQTSNLRTGSTSRFSFNVQNTESAVDNAVVRVTVPLTYLETYGSLGEYFPGQGIDSLLSSRVEGNNLIVDYNVQNLSETYNQNFTFEFKSIDNGSMSNGAQIPVKAAVVKSGSAVAQTSNVTYHYVTRQPHFSTNVTYPAEASEDDDEDAQQQTEVLFSFSFGDEGAGNGSGRSGVNSIAVTANVPESLTFDSSLNEGWSYDEGSRTASYSFTPDASIYDAAYSMPTTLSLLATSNDKDIQESIYAEATFTFANGDVVNKTNQAEVAMMMTAFDVGIMEVVEQNLISSFQFTVNPGQADERTVISGEVLLADLANMATIRLDYGITKPDAVDVADGDQYIIDLPEIFTGFATGDQEIRVEGELVATYNIVGGQIIITFTELANDYDDTEMHVIVTGDFNVELFEEKDETVVNVPLQDEADFTLTIRPEQEDYAGQDKKEAGEAYILDNGEKVFTNRNPEFVDWKVIANDSMASISNARVIDTLGDNLVLDPDTIKVERIIRDFRNEEVGREAVVVTPTLTDTGFELDLGEIEDAYEISYTTAITRPEGGGEHTLYNSARIELDGESNNYSDEVPVTWSGDIPTLTKAGVISDNRQDVIDWTVEYNYGKEPLSSVTLTDSLSHGEINLDSVVVLQVETDIDGDVVGSGTPVSITPVLTDNGMTLPGLDADGKAYLITFSSTVPVGLTDTIVNTISDDLTNPNTAEASVPVNTMPKGTKLGEQAIDPDGRPYIDWTVTMNSEKVNVPSIEVRDVFDSDFLEFDIGNTVLNYLTKDGVRVDSDSFDIESYTHTDLRTGFYLNIPNAGPHEYKFVYRTYYTVAGMQETALSNHAELVFLDGEGVGIGDTITVNPSLKGPTSGISKSGKYVRVNNNVDQQIEWVVTFNNSKILLNAGTTLTDTFTSGNYSYVANSLVLSPNVAHSFSENNDGFVLELTEPTKETITVTFRTSTDDANSTNPEYTNNALLKWQGGEEGANAKVEVRHPGMNKSGVVVINDDGTKRIDWTVNFNTNANVIHDFNLVDTYTPTTVTVSDIVIKSGDNDVTSAFTISSERTGGSFTVEKDKLDAVAYQLTYSTTLSAAEEAGEIKNTAAITYTGGEDDAEATIASPTIGVEKVAVGLVDKTAAGDFINWKITANTDKTNKYVNLVNAILEDTIPSDQILVRDTIVVTREDGVDSTALSTITQEDNSFSIILPGGPYQYVVTFQTEILEYPSVGATIGQYENDTELTNQPGVEGLESSDDANAFINYFGDGTNNDSTKEGVINDETENVDWKVVLNPLGLTINNARVEDTLTGDHNYVADSIKVWDATNPEAPVELGAGSYSVTPGDKTFTVNFLPGTITTPIMVTYSTRINEDVIGRRDLSNSIKLFGGDRTDAIDEESTTFAATQWFYGGGGSGRTLQFTLNKLNSNNKTVENTTFEFIRVTASGNKVPLNNVVTTDSSGKFNLTDVRAGRYIVNELSAPTAYDRLTNPIYIIVGYTTPAEQTVGAGEYKVTVTDSNWNPITSGPASAEGNTLTVVNQFKTRNIAATKIWRGGPWSTEERPEAYLQLHRRVSTDEEGEAVPNLNPIKVSDSNDPDVVSGASVVQVGWENVETYSPEGNLYQYFVREVDAQGNELNLEGYEQSYGLLQNNLPNYLTVINTNVEKLSINGTKTWVDYDNAHNTRPQLLVVQLIQYLEDESGERIEEKVFREQTIGADSEGNWDYSFAELPKYDSIGRVFKYEVSERVPAPYVMTKDGDNLTNTYTNTEKVTISGQKVWSDFNNSLDTRPDKIEIGLYREIDGVRDEQFGETKEVTPDDTGNWYYNFNDIDLPKHDENGKEYVYVLEELTEIANYTPTITGTSLITNTYDNADTVNVSGQKTWNDWVNDENQEYQTHQRPDSITIKLFQDDQEIDEIKVTAEDQWQYNFSDLPKHNDIDGGEFTYRIEEVAIPGYSTEYVVTDNLHNITNTYINSETTEISGYKIWDDYNNKFNTRPTSIMVQLTQNNINRGEPVQVTVDGGGLWQFKFNKLPKYDSSGEEYKYSIIELETQEDDLLEYEKSYIETAKGWDIRNSFENTETTGISFNKVWKDWVSTGNEDNQITPRPASVTISVLQNGLPFIGMDNEPVKRVLSDANGWEYSLSNLPKYDTAGELFVYSISEDNAETGDLVDYKHSINGFTVTNTYQNTELVDISGNKVWVDYSDAHDTRPEEIAVYLLQDGIPYGSSLIVTDDGDDDDEWAFEVTGLPKFDANGKEYIYTFDEVATAPYVKTIDEAGRVITNTYINTEVINLIGQKVWADYSNEYGLRPEVITVNLFRNGDDQEVSQDVKATPAGQWIYNFEGLAKYDEKGIAYTYTVTEDKVEGYTTVIDGEGFVINTIDPQNTGIAGEKTWVDYDNKFETRPESITVNLLQNGKYFAEQEVTPNDDGQWFYQFTDIPDRDEDGEPYVYTVEEEAVEKEALAQYEVTYDGYNITNTYVNTETVDINGEKVWADYNDKFETRPDSILVVLYRNGSEDSFRRVVADADDNWKFSFADLPVYDAEGNAYEYSVEEITVRPYTSEKTLDDEGFVTFTNTYINKETTEFNGQKHWEDFDDKYGLRPESINVILNQNDIEFEGQTVEADQRGNWRYNFNNLPKYDELGNVYKYSVEDNTHAYKMDTYYNDLYNALITTDVVGTKTWSDFEDKFGLRPDSITINLNQTIEGSEESSVLHSTEVSAGNNWSYAFNDIPAFDADGNEYIYSVSEEAIEDKPLGAYDFDTVGYNLINTLVTTQVEVTKTWHDFEDGYGLRPETINFNLLQNGEEFDSVTVSADENWSHNFTNIPQFNASGEAYVYTVTEDKVEAYETVVSDYVVNNTLITQDIKGTKTWHDFEDKFGLRPDAITVNLVQGIAESEESSVLKTVVVTAEEEWAFEFADVPVYDAAGNEYIYTLTEEVNAAYSPVIDNDAYSITNNLKLTEFTGNKVWKDSDDQFGLRPDAITVRLFQTIPGSVEQVEITNQVVTAENDWTFTFSELPLVNAAGVEYIYSITEDEINAYATEINGSEITNSLITVPVAGQKVWNDYNNKFEVRPETITVNLLQNGEALVALPVTAAEDGSWSFSFGEVPEFDAEGVAYVYTVTEDAVPEYNAPEINGTIITNTYVNTDVIAVSGEKLWDDFENRLDSRPESITVVLLQNGEAFLDPQVVTPDVNNKWIYSFTDLPEYDELGEAYTYTIEELAVERYETTYGENGEITNTLIPAISVSVGDYVWYDANKDGLQDETDVPLAGVVLTIENADGSPVTDIEGLPVGPQVTDENGHYSFDKLPADATYVVRIDQAASAEALKDYTPTIDETGGDNSIDSSTWSATSRHLVEDEERDPTLDFGFVLKKVSVGDYVWIDENKDGLQDETDVPLAGVVLTITTKDGKAVKDINGNPVGPTTTDENGWYTFDNLPANETYIVTIDQVASKDALKGLMPTIEVQGDNSIDSSTWTATSRHLTEDEERDPTLDFGFVRKKVSVGDYVWIDVNRDGLQDGTDIPLAGVVLTIKTKDGKEVTDVNGNPVGPTTTDGKGWYTFDNLPADETYVVTIDQEASKEALKDLLPTIETEGSIATDSSTWTATSRELTKDEERDPTLDFGFVRKKVSVGDYVWFDKDKDGVQGEDEPGIPNVILEIRDEDGNPVTDVYGKPVGPQTTDKNGKYSFDDLPTDKVYVVTIAQEQPALDGYKTTKENQGDPATDSSTWTATSRHMTEDEDRDPTLDFGFYIPSGSVGDYVWFDKNNDGLQDKTDVPLKGVVLTIEDEAGNPVTDVFGNPVQPQTTDENGYYIFDNLPLGHRYTVRIDQVASADVLKGYETALEAQGNDFSIDSSTWFAVSVELTEDGQHDPTLDFGFILKETKKPTNTGTPTGPTGKLPSTGDTTWVWYGLMVLALGSAAIFTGRRRREEE